MKKNGTTIVRKPAAVGLSLIVKKQQRCKIQHGYLQQHADNKNWDNGRSEK